MSPTLTRFFVENSRLLALSLVAVIVIAILFFVRQRSAAVPEPTPPSTPLRDGGREISVDSKGQLHGLTIDDPELRRTAIRVMQTGLLSPPPLPTDLSQGRESVKNDVKTAALPLRPLTPVGQIVLSDRPAFRWYSAAGAISFQVRIYDTASHEVMASPSLKTTEWTPADPLQRGQVYSWKVVGHYDFKVVTAPESPEPPARFRVLPPADADKFAAVAGQNSQFLLAVTAAGLGLESEASSALDRLQAENPGSPLLQKLRDSLKLQPSKK